MLSCSIPGPTLGGSMRRRDFITLPGSVAAVLPLMARAQQPATMKRIGVLMGAFAPTDPDGQAALSALLTTLQAPGWTPGNNAQIEVHWIGPEVEHGNAEAAKLVAWAPEVPFCSSSSATDLLSQSTHTIAIVFAQVTDPIGSGWVKSHACPEGNLTGFTSFEAEVGGKWLDILKEIAPRVSRVTVLFYPETPAYVALWHRVEAAAAPLAIKANAAGVHDAAEIEQAIAHGCRASRQRPGGSSDASHQRQSRSHCGLGGAPSFARRLSLALLRYQRRTGLIRFRQSRSLSACSVLCESHSQRRETGRRGLFCGQR
jgi:hypothetical protein